jgi:hypothetical protein
VFCGRDVEANALSRMHGSGREGRPRVVAKGSGSCGYDLGLLPLKAAELLEARLFGGHGLGSVSLGGMEGAEY